MKSIKPIVVTMGEPSGISSEIIIKIWKKRKILGIPPFILVDDLQKLKKINSTFSYNVNFHQLDKKDDVLKIFTNSLPIIDLKCKIISLPQFC